jgi:hypothetical protein
MTCPACGSEDTRSSKRFRLGDVLQRLRGRGAFRCRQCQKRFYSTVLSDPSSFGAILFSHSLGATPRIRAKTKRRLVRWMIVTAVFGFAFIVFWVFLRSFMAE